jgi:hypothetical protein
VGKDKERQRVSGTEGSRNREDDRQKSGDKKVRKAREIKSKNDRRMIVGL